MQFAKRKQHFSFLQNMFRHSCAVIFSYKCSTVVHLKFHYMHDCVTELRHEIYKFTNIGIRWEQRTALAPAVVKKKKKTRNK